MSPDNTHNFMGFYMEVLILSVILVYASLSCSYRVYRVKCCMSHSIRFTKCAQNNVQYLFCYYYVLLLQVLATQTLISFQIT